VVFADLGGYTSLNERLDPETVESLMSQLKASASRIVEAHGGMVNQFVGDEVLALFGVPTAHEDDPVRAIRAAQALHDMARDLSARVEDRIGQSLRFHTGINTGLLIARRRDRRDGTFGITGDVVNTAARLVGQAGADEIVISPGTQRLVVDYYTTIPLDPVVLRGKADAVRPYRIVGKTAVASRWEAAQRRGLTRYAGRESELATLRDAMARTRAGHGQFVTVMGEPGIGKSRLMFELRHALEGEDVAISEGRCQADGIDTPYLPFVDALRYALRLQEVTEAAALPERALAALRMVGPDLKPYLPYLLHLLAMASNEYPIPTGLQAGPLRRALDESLAALLTLTARTHPVLLILEDWHWADEASDHALKYLVGLVPHHQMMVVVTYRPDYTRAWSAAEYYTPLVMKPLDAHHTEAMVRSVLGAMRLPDGLVDRIHQRTGGNALFNEEVARSLVEEGAVVVAEGSVSSVGAPRRYSSAGYRASRTACAGRSPRTGRARGFAAGLHHRTRIRRSGARTAIRGA
jgi:class 3 adenylate cyclase